MTQLPQQQQVVRATPQANVYTILLVVAVLALAATIGVVVWNLMDTYALSIGQIFGLPD